VHDSRFWVFTHVLPAEQPNRLAMMLIELDDAARTASLQMPSDDSLLLPFDYFQPADSRKLDFLAHLKGDLDAL
jgi:hypothetical protein